MAMTLETKIKSIRSYADSMDRYAEDGSDFVNAASYLREYAAHLSAQAKVRVTRIEVDRAWDIYTGVAGVFCSRDGLRSVLEDFAARLPQVDPTNLRECTQWSQGAQGEAVAWRFLYRPTLDQEFSTEGRQWVDGSPDVAAEMHGRDPKRWIIQIAYSHPAERDHEMGVPSGDDEGQLFVHGSKEALQRVQWYIGQAERAAVPDGWVLAPREPTADMKAAATEVPRELPVIGTQCVGEAWAADIYRAMLSRVLNPPLPRDRITSDAVGNSTAAAQPPEGARVVDGLALVDRSIIDSIIKQCDEDRTDYLKAGWLADSLRKALSAPTLAGKEG